MDSVNLHNYITTAQRTGSADAAPAFFSAIADAVSQGIALVDAGGTYRFDSPVLITSLSGGLTLRGSDHRSIIRSNAAVAQLYFLGSIRAKVNLGVNAMVGSFTVTLTTGMGSLYAAGAFIGYESTLTVYTSPNTNAKEIHKVLSVAGDVVTLDSPLVFSYNISDTAQFYKVNPLKNLYVEGFAFENLAPTPTPATVSAPRW